MTQINVITETDTPRGWSFLVTAQNDQATYEFQINLSWADYDLWSRGQLAPERVAQAALTFLLQHQSLPEIKQTFDCATLRRSHPQIDTDLPKLLGHP